MVSVAMMLGRVSGVMKTLLWLCGYDAGKGFRGNGNTIVVSVAVMLGMYEL